MTSKTLEDTVDFIRGITFKPSQLVALDDPSAVVCMRTKNIQKDLDESDLIAVPTKLVRDPNKELRPGDTLISTANSWELVGKVSYVGELGYRATAGGFIGVIRPKSHINSRFLYHWLNSPKSQHLLRHCGRQTTNISNLSIARFKELKFPDFKAREQRRIAAILDQADAIRRKREQALKLADEFLKSVFLDMFGDPLLNPKNWPVQPMNSYLEELRYGTSTKSYATAAKGSTPVLRIPNVINESINWAGLKFASLNEKEVERLRLRSGDILFVRTNGNPLFIGRCAVFNDTRNATFASYLIRARLNDGAKVLPEFLAACLSMPSYRSRIVKVATTTAGNYNINTKNLGGLPIIEPPLQIQQKFVGVTKALHDHVTRLEVDASNAEQLFGALSKNAFLGKL
ncbi:MAG TPA: restriction endonuclease subunit S [Rhodobacteraceae bacterium]|nr:restriction endonuclease subunit S [Paracoccaceae bacterium]